MQLDDFLKIINAQTDPDLKTVLQNVYSEMQNMKKTMDILEKNMDHTKTIESLVDTVNHLVANHNIIRTTLSPIVFD